MKIKINVRLECAPAAEGATLVVRKRFRDFEAFQRATGWKMAEIQDQVEHADILGVPLAAFFALSNAGFTPDWDELRDCEPDAFEQISEPGDDRPTTETIADPQQLPADSSPAGGGDDPAAAGA